MHDTNCRLHVAGVGAMVGADGAVWRTASAERGAHAAGARHAAPAAARLVRRPRHALRRHRAAVRRRRSHATSVARSSVARCGHNVTITIMSCCIFTTHDILHDSAYSY